MIHHNKIPTVYILTYKPNLIYKNKAKVGGSAYIWGRLIQKFMRYISTRAIISVVMNFHFNGNANFPFQIFPIYFERTMILLFSSFSWVALEPTGSSKCQHHIESYDQAQVFSHCVESIDHIDTRLSIFQISFAWKYIYMYIYCA